MLRLADWHYTGVPRLGTVHFSPKALVSLQGAGISSPELEEVLTLGRDFRAVAQPYSGTREYNGIRLCLKTRPHLKGAAVVCIDGYRVKL